MPRLDTDALNSVIDAGERDRREESATRRLLKRVQAENEGLEKLVDLLTAIDAIQVTPAEWAQPRKTVSDRGNRAVANLMLSDLHLDEVVDKGEMRGKNAYNRKIALQRLQRLSSGTIKMARDYISGVNFDGLYLWCNGDMISGNIHDELERTNDGVHPLESVDYWVDHLASFVDHLADHFGKVHLVWSYGNHGRSYKKPPAKGAVKSSFDWFLARALWREMKGDERLSWNIPQSRDVRENVYSTRYLMTHGDDFKGGDQIAGAVRPVMMGDYRTLVVEVADGEPYDMLLVGHFHQYHGLPRAVINGSLVGYNEYAKNRKFRPEPPKQAFWLTTPEHGPSMHLPILPGNRKSEKW